MYIETTKADFLNLLASITHAIIFYQTGHMSNGNTHVYAKLTYHKPGEMPEDITSQELEWWDEGGIELGKGDSTWPLKIWLENAEKFSYDTDDGTIRIDARPEEGSEVLRHLEILPADVKTAKRVDKGEKVWR